MISHVLQWQKCLWTIPITSYGQSLRTLKQPNEVSPLYHPSGDTFIYCCLLKFREESLWMMKISIQDFIYIFQYFLDYLLMSLKYCQFERWKMISHVLQWQKCLWTIPITSYGQSLRTLKQPNEVSPLYHPSGDTFIYCCLLKFREESLWMMKISIQDFILTLLLKSNR